MRAQITLELSWFDESDSSEQIARKIAELVTDHTTADVDWWEGHELELVVHHITELGFTRRKTEWVVKDDNFFANEAS